jgi:hypothetical protein
MNQFSLDSSLRRTIEMRTLTILCLLGAGAISSQAQAELRITDPTLFTVVRPGQTVSVKVSASGGPFKSLLFVAPDHTKATGKEVLDSTPYEFSFTVSSHVPTPGTYGGGVMGFPLQGELVTAQFVIDIERPDVPNTISVDSNQLELSVGDQLPIQVFGVYGDGATLRLTRSTLTKYHADDPKIVSVSPGGEVTAVAQGATIVTVRHLGREAMVWVNVVKLD